MTTKVKANHFLVDEHGRPEAVVLSLTDYKRLLRRLEDQEDVLALKRAIQTSPGLVSHATLVERLKRQGLL